MALIHPVNDVDCHMVSLIKEIKVWNKINHGKLVHGQN